MGYGFSCPMDFICPQRVFRNTRRNTQSDAFDQKRNEADVQARVKWEPEGYLQQYPRSRSILGLTSIDLLVARLECSLTHPYPSSHSHIKLELPVTTPTQPHNPLHGLTLEFILTELVAYYGWDGLNARIQLKCFAHEPSIKSSLKLLRKTPWAREKVEGLYGFMLREVKRGER